MGYVAVNLLLDTHIWLWWINQNGPLTNQHRETIAQAEHVFISSISCLDFQHRDPADRFIIATALLADCQIMSFDGQFKFYAELDNRLIGNH
jgi:PIN domain nuclease of toxin-antitoxin system